MGRIPLENEPDGGDCTYQLNISLFSRKINPLLEEWNGTGLLQFDQPGLRKKVP
jgi:hypothetical protein